VVHLEQLSFIVPEDHNQNHKWTSFITRVFNSYSIMPAVTKIKEYSRVNRRRLLTTGPELRHLQNLTKILKENQ